MTLSETARPPITQFDGPHRFLSNFAAVPGGVVALGMRAESTEHIYQAAKTLDPIERDEILAAPTPGIAKRMGLRVSLRPDWDHVRLGVMSALLEVKFDEPSLGALLLATGDAELVEGNHWHDVYYGRCHCPRHQGEGQNWLGRLLVLRRSQLRLLIPEA